MDEEISFRDLKYPLCLKAFHSQKYEYIIQEVWARAILYNFCSEIAMAVECPEKKRKYVYQVNYSEAIKICRDFLRIHDGTTLDVEADCSEYSASQARTNIPSPSKVQTSNQLLLPKLTKADRNIINILQNETNENDFF